MNVAALDVPTFFAHQCKLRPYLTKSVKYSVPPMELSEIEEVIITGSGIPVVFLEQGEIIGIMVITLTEKSLHVLAMAGDFTHDWRDAAFECVRQVALSQDRKEITFAGRHGWARYLKAWDVEIDGSLLRKRL